MEMNAKGFTIALHEVTKQLQLLTGRLKPCKSDPASYKHLNIKRKPAKCCICSSFPSPPLPCRLISGTWMCNSSAITLFLFLHGYNRSEDYGGFCSTAWCSHFINDVCSAQQWRFARRTSHCWAGKVGALPSSTRSINSSLSGPKG